MKIRPTIVRTELGTFSFVASRTGGCPVRLEKRRIDPPLPDGMHVQRVRAVLLTAAACETESILRFSCELDGDTRGYPCTGEGLSAQEWQASGHLVVVGTEDEDFLGDRLPFLDISDYDGIVRYWGQGLEIVLQSVPANRAVTLHFNVAENPAPEPAEASAWYAVDVTHKFILEHGQRD